MNPEEKNPLQSLRTYQGDIEETLSKNKTSISSIVIMEQKRREQALGEDGLERNSGRRNKFFIIIGGTLLLLGITTVGIVYYMQSQNEIIVVQKTKALLAFGEEKIVPIETQTREKLVSLFDKEKESFKLPVNSILYINIVGEADISAPITLVLSLLAPRMPPSLLRSFEEKYMLGVYSFDTNEFFIILKTSDFATSFAGMLKWEADLQKDIGVLFDIEQNASTTINIFVDRSLKNKDLRILKDSVGNTLLLYSFVDKNTLIITKNETVFGAILPKYLIHKAAL